MRFLNIMKRSSVEDKTSLWAKAKNFFKRGFSFRYWLYRLKWAHYPTYRIVNPFPLHVDIETTDACNLRCKMCVHGMGGLKNTGFISTELAYKAINECADLGVYSIKFNFRGEPLLHKNIVDFVRYAKKKGILEVQFNSNGLPANPQKIRDLIDAGLDRIIFSIDGATKETYESIRIGGSYEKILENVNEFISIKKENNLIKPFIRVQMVVFPGKEEEAKQFISFWSEKGVDNVATIDKQDRDSEHGLPLKNGIKPTGRSFCDQPWQRLNINRDGKVLMCCGDWDRKTLVGDFSKQTIKEIWLSEKMQSYRKKIGASRLDEIPACKTCFRTPTYKWD